MRLIDADKIEINEEYTFSGKGIKDFLDAIPTAYNVDKVVEHIESSSTDKDGIVCYVDEKPVITKEVAIKIIKSGGIE